MGTAPETIRRLVDRFDRDRKVFLSPDYREERLPKAKTPHEQESLKRTIEATDNQIASSAQEMPAAPEPVG